MSNYVTIESRLVPLDNGELERRYFAILHEVRPGVPECFYSLTHFIGGRDFGFRNHHDAVSYGEQALFGDTKPVSTLELVDGEVRVRPWEPKP